MTTKKIKELDIPVDKQSGSYTATMSFSTPSPGFVYVQLTDQDGNELWRELITESPVTLEAGFSHTNLTKLILNRFESNAYAVTSYIFELYWLPTPPPECYSNDECLTDYFCEFPVGTCEGPGVCVQKPDFCPMVYEPVCGCNGITYSNDCLRAQAGVSKLHDGACGIPTICVWIEGIGGWEAIMTSHIMDLVSGYLGVKDLGFTVTIAYIMGVVAYYLNQPESGDSHTDCDFFP